MGVHSEPEIVVNEVTSEDKCIVLASDGVWEFIESQVQQVWLGRRK